MRHSLTNKEAQRVGACLGIDFNEVDLEQFRIGMAVELEHGMYDLQTNAITNDDLCTTGSIAWAHLKKLPDYYARLARAEHSSHAESLSNTPAVIYFFYTTCPKCAKVSDKKLCHRICADQINRRQTTT